MLHHHAPTIFAFAAGLVTAGVPLLALWRRDAREAKAATAFWAKLSVEARDADARTISGLRRRLIDVETKLQTERAARDTAARPEMAVL